MSEIIYESGSKRDAECSDSRSLKNKLEHNQNSFLKSAKSHASTEAQTGSMSHISGLNQPPPMPHISSPKRLSITSPKQGKISNKTTNPASPLSLRPIALRDRISSVDRKHMLSHMQIGDDNDESESSYDSYDESSIENYEDSPSLTTSPDRSRSQGQSVPGLHSMIVETLPLDTFSRPRSSRISSNAHHATTSPIASPNSSSSMETDESAFTSDDESSYFSEQYNHKDRNSIPYLNEFDRRPTLPLRPHSNTSGLGLPLSNSSISNPQNLSNSRNQSSASLSLSDSSDDYVEHRSSHHKHIPYPKRDRSEDTNNVMRSPIQEYDNYSRSSNINSEIFRASNNNRNKGLHKYRPTGHRPSNPVVVQISGDEEFSNNSRKQIRVNKKNRDHSQSSKIKNEPMYDPESWRYQGRDWSTYRNHMDARPLNKSPPYLHSGVEANMTQKNGKPIQQPKFIHYPSQNYEYYSKNNQIQPLQNDFFISNNQSPPLTHSTGSTTLGTESSTDSHDYHGTSSHQLSKTPSSPFTAYSGSRLTLNMEYSSDDGSDFLDQDESFAGNAMEYFAKTYSVKKADSFIQSEHVNSSSKLLYKKRWLMVFFISALNFLSEWICYSSAPISTIFIIQNSKFLPTSLVSMFLIGKCFTVTQEPFIFSKLGVKRTVMLGSGLLWLSTLVKATKNNSISISIFRIYLRYFIAGMSQPLYQHAGGAIATSWFPEAQRQSAICFMLNFKRLGICFAFLFGTKTVITEDEVPAYFRNFGLLSACICLGVCMLFDDKPHDHDENESKVERSPHPNKGQNRGRIFREGMNNVESRNSSTLKDREDDFNRTKITRATTSSGQSTGPPGYYHGHTTLGSTSEGARFMNSQQDETSLMSKKSELYGSTATYQNKISNFSGTKHSSAGEVSLFFPAHKKDIVAVNKHDHVPSQNVTQSTSPESVSTARFHCKDIFFFVNSCLSYPGFRYSLVSFLPASIVITSLTANMDLIITNNTLQNVENRRLDRAILGSFFQAIVLISSIMSGKQNGTKSRSYYSSILGFHILGTFALSACVMSLDPEQGWDERLFLLLVGALVGPLQSISTEFGVSIAHPMSKQTVLIVQEFFADVICAFFIPLFQILSYVGVSPKDQISLDSSGKTKNSFAFSLEILIGLHLCSALFFATFKGRYDQLATRKDASRANYMYVRSEEKNDSSSMDRSENARNVLGDEESQRESSGSDSSA